MIARLFRRWSFIALLGLVHCSTVTGEHIAEEKNETEGLGGAEPDTGGTIASASGGSRESGTGSTPGSGGEPDEGATGGADGDSDGDSDGAGGAADSSGGAPGGTGGTVDSSGGDTGSGGTAAPRPGHIVVMSKTQGFRHTSAIPAGLTAMSSIADDEGFKVTVTEDSTFFTAQNLADVGAIVFLNTSGDIFDTSQKMAFEEFISGGGGFIGIHAAADTERDWSFYTKLLGAVVTTHSLQDLEASMDVEVSDHPATKGLNDPWVRSDEWYNYSANPREVTGVQVLLNLDENSYSGGNMGDHPIAWTRTVGQSRIFYTGMGHQGAAYVEDDFLRHLRGALLWVLRRD